MLTEKKISSENVFDGVLLHVYKDKIELPNGNTATREYIKHQGAVCVVPVTDNNEIIAVRQYRYPIGRVTVEIPAGRSKKVELTGSFDNCVRGETYYLYIGFVGLGGAVLPSGIEYVYETLGIADNLATGGTRLYPNPVGNVLNVVDGRGIDRVQVLGLTGSQVLDANVGGDTAVTIDMSALPAGTYIVRIVTIDGTATMQKIIKK